jgi:predicted esterase
VAIGHGSRDPVIGIEWGRDARDRLRDAGADVTYEEHPGGHQIDPRFLSGLPAWVQGAVGARTG